MFRDDHQLQGCYACLELIAFEIHSENVRLSRPPVFVWPVFALAASTCTEAMVSGARAEVERSVHYDNEGHKRNGQQDFPG